MAYNFTKSDGTAVTVADNTVVSNQFSIDLLGRNVSGYGMYVARNFVRMLEHFADDTAPALPARGQVWFDTTAQSLKVYNGSAWKTIMTSGADDGDTFIFTQDLVPDVTCTGGNGIDIGTTLLRFCNVWADTFHGVATSAQYADLAERYEADAAYDAGTILALGGDKEVTVMVPGMEYFGIVSTKPGFILNAEVGNNETHPMVAMVGRVPVKVIGKVNKFDKLVLSDMPGVAMARPEGSDAEVIGRALHAKDSDGLDFVEVTVGAR